MKYLRCFPTDSFHLTLCGVVVADMLLGFIGSAPGAMSVGQPEVTAPEPFAIISFERSRTAVMGIEAILS